MKLEDWNPCKRREDHNWVFDTSCGYYVCQKCSATGWGKYYPAGSGWTMNGPSVTPLKCPGCKGLTPFPKALCPTCIANGTAKVSKKRRYRWIDLTISEQKALIYLRAKEEPATVSRRNGGGSLPSLVTKGLIEPKGDCSGQKKWLLTESARDMLTIIEQKEGGELHVST